MLELRSNARFARLRERSGAEGPTPRPTGIGRALLWIHILIYWFFLVPFLTPMSYATGFAVYAA
ncbi:MAG: hypothetical protein AAF211_05755, partial [Myxococcota bacterium]